MSSIVYDYMDWPRIEAVVYGEESSPKDVMAPRLTKDGILIQGFFPEAKKVSVKTGKKIYEMELEDESGYFAAMIPGRKIPSYTFLVEKEKKKTETEDPYSFPGQITEDEEKAFMAGVFYDCYKKLGAHPMELEGVKGTFFAVWAPNAVRVSVVGDFNEWDGRCHAMHRMPMSGIFELFIPGVKSGDIYKYELKTKGGSLFVKADPYASEIEKAPGTASIVADLSGFVWEDSEWQKQRALKEKEKRPLAVLETSLLEWENFDELVSYAKELNYTHVELAPVMGNLGEPFDTFAYYAPDSRIGGSAVFMKLINEFHKAGIGVILDWVPSHFPKHGEGLENFDGTKLYENPDPVMSVHPFWGSTLFNYESPMVADFLLGNAFYWTEIFHADGLRLDDVDVMLYLDYGREYGQWTPNIYGSNENLAAVEFLKHFNSILHKRVPGILTIAQEDGLWAELTDSVDNDHVGFDYKWNNNWTSDFVGYLSSAVKDRKDLHDQLTLSMLYTYCEHFWLTLGSRDVGSLTDFMKKLPGSEEEKLSQIKAAYTWQLLHPGCIMNAPGKDAPQELKTFIRDLNALYRSCPALYEKDDEYEGFEWIQLMKYEENMLTFLRKTDKAEETLLAVVNFSDTSYKAYQTGVPFAGKYKEIFNTDNTLYGGNGFVNPRAKQSKAEECDERENSVKFKIPAFGAAVFSCTPDTKNAERKTADPKPANRKIKEKKTAVKKTAVRKSSKKA